MTTIIGMKITPKSRRAKNRALEHILDPVREGTFAGKRALLCRCRVPECPWTGWLTEDEVDWTTDGDDNV